jgi:hypothetical protein
MPLRWQQFASSWQTYSAILAGSASFIELLTGIITKTLALITAFHGLPSEVRLVVVAVLAIVTVILFRAALSRRSVLRKPERFIVSADDPRYLAGREEHIQAPADECTHAPLVSSLENLV